MLRYRRKRSNTLKRAMTLLAIPLVLTSTGYALFSQDLTVDGNVTKPAYSRSQSLLMTYDKVVTVFNQNRWEYNLTITIENQGTSNVNSWHLTFDLPSNNTGFRCFDDTVCVENNGAVTIDNGTSTAIITAGNSVSFTMRFRLTTDTYSLQNIDISGTYAPTYQTISGLTASHVLGSRNKHQGVFYWYHDFTVTNNSGQDLQAWRIIAQWDSSTNAVWANGTDTTINYYEDTSELRLLSTQPLADGDSFTFTADLGDPDRNWVLGTYYIEGAP